MGGAAGHMAHPYNVCDTGRELIDLYEYKIPEYLAKNFLSHDDENEITLKIDGINASFRIVKESNDSFKPLIDRGAIQHDVLGNMNLHHHENKKGIHYKPHDEHTRFTDETGNIRLTPFNVYKRLFSVLKEAFDNKVIKDILNTKELGFVNYSKKYHYTNVIEHSNSHVLHTFDSMHDNSHEQTHEAPINIAHAVPERKHAIFNIEAVHPSLKNIIEYSELDIKKVVTKTFDLNKDFFESADKDKITEFLSDNSPNKQQFMFFVVNGIIEKDYINLQKELSAIDPKFEPNKLKIVARNIGHRSIKEMEKNDIYFKLFLKTLNKHALKHRCAFITRIKVKPVVTVQKNNENDYERLVAYFHDAVKNELDKSHLICNTRKSLRKFLEEINDIKSLEKGSVRVEGFDPSKPNEIKAVKFLNKKTLYDFIVNKKNGHVNLDEHVEFNGSTNPNDKLSLSSSDDAKLKNIYHKIINGCTIWLSTKVIGDVLLKLMKTDTMGLIHSEGGGTQHEGIVLDNLIGDNTPVKITGSFIDRFDESEFEKK